MPDNTALKKVLDALSEKSQEGEEKKSKKTSGWKVFFYVIGAIILVAIAVIPAVLARRKAAKIAHERDKLLEEKQQAVLKANLDEEKDKRADLLAEIGELQKKAEALQIELTNLEEKRKKFADSVSAITDWSDIPEWGE